MGVLVRAHRGLANDGDIAVVDQPPGGVIESGLKTKLLQNEETDAGNGEQAHQGEGHQQREQGDVWVLKRPSVAEEEEQVCILEEKRRRCHRWSATRRARC